LILGVRQQRDRAERHQDREPAHPIEQDGVEREPGSLSAAEIQSPNDVPAQRRDAEQVEEHPDQVEAAVVDRAPREADRSAQQEPLIGGEELPDQVQNDRNRHPLEPDTCDGMPQMLSVHVDQNIGDDSEADREPEPPPPCLPQPTHAVIVRHARAFATCP
jgi:hypothetical protein